MAIIAALAFLPGNGCGGIGAVISGVRSSVSLRHDENGNIKSAYHYR
ncbi:hypothetical protein V4C53_20815 [Paraburkholderia azotifigens]